MSGERLERFSKREGVEKCFEGGLSVDGKESVKESMGLRFGDKKTV